MKSLQSPVNHLRYLRLSISVPPIVRVNNNNTRVRIVANTLIHSRTANIIKGAYYRIVYGNKWYHNIIMFIMGILSSYDIKTLQVRIDYKFNRYRYLVYICIYILYSIQF